MTGPVDPVAQLRADVDALRAEVDASKAEVTGLAKQVRQALKQHFQDHAASGYDFRRAQTDSKNVRPPAPADILPEDSGQGTGGQGTGRTDSAGPGGQDSPGADNAPGLSEDRGQVRR